MGSLDYTIIDTNGIPVTLSLYAEFSEESLSFAIDASDHGEASFQLIEGFSYEYVITDKYRLDELSGIVKRSKRDNYWGGRITPGIYVGTLSLDVFDPAGNKTGTFYLEVKSIKSTYRDEYRFMLENITDYCTDLLMQHTSPAVQNFTPDFSSDPDTIYQRFAFIKSIIDSPEFNEAVHKIISDPVTSWSDTDEKVDIRKLKRLGSAGLRQIASGQNRIKLPDNHYLKKVCSINDIPAKISVSRKIETVDTPENRFVKHALEVFLSFCSTVRYLLENAKREKTRSFSEAVSLEENLSQILNHDLFRQISIPSTLPLNSPVLQRKEGYREVLRAWLLFDLAAKLVWKGGDDVYSAGKRDIAQLYEYWLFFKLLKILKEVFDIEPDSIDKLIETTNDGLGLKLKSGEYTPLKGVYKNQVRNLRIKFCYNRTFRADGEYPGDPKGSSWSRSMRPDYTLSIWPEGYTSKEAELNEIITHVHFDAKYRVENLNDILGDKNPDLDEEKIENRSGTYKRADLLKMHAYKDAIRRTGGAYVLYPGNTNTDPMKGFHEIIPGLGAFAIRPSRGDDGSEALKKFIVKIVEHFLNRASQHERMTYYTYEIHGDKNNSDVKEPVSENPIKTRTKPPADIPVIIGYYKKDQYNWIVKNNVYNVRIDTIITTGMAGARYLLLYNTETESAAGDIWEIKGEGPELWDREQMMELDYPHQVREAYIVYRINKCINGEFKDYLWDVAELKKGKNKNEEYYRPFSVSLLELMNVKM